MKFFKSYQPRSEEDEAAAVRLTAVAARTKTAEGTRPSWEEPAQLDQGASDPLELREVLQ
jgi:hypothetical protein